MANESASVRCWLVGMGGGLEGLIFEITPETCFQDRSLPSRKITLLVSEEMKQAPESNSDVAEILELSEWEFKTTKMNMLKSLIEKMDNVQEQMRNISKKWKT
ncbi:unnamed protein product [Rangifer tarandus platyrhynchus]|uniref:Uncharacterized protein n=2 Tax=Rangifer tarandus platyrhynchus TaxID=3082113 RepID=A0ABN8ZDC6_RANTA|nr:unnamed protein product [Rangifer tarandus platyrhynchus]